MDTEYRILTLWANNKFVYSICTFCIQVCTNEFFPEIVETAMTHSIACIMNNEMWKCIVMNCNNTSSGFAKYRTNVYNF